MTRIIGQTMDELAALLDEACVWITIDAAGEPTGRHAVSLRDAVRAARDGQAITRLSGAALVVTDVQVRALRALIAEL